MSHLNIHAKDATTRNITKLLSYTRSLACEPIGTGSQLYQWIAMGLQKASESNSNIDLWTIRQKNEREDFNGLKDKADL